MDLQIFNLKSALKLRLALLMSNSSFRDSLYLSTCPDLLDHYTWPSHESPGGLALCQTIGIGQVPLSFIHQSETVALSLENYRADPG